MHMHFYCYLTGGTAYLLDRGKEWCYSEMQEVWEMGDFLAIPFCPVHMDAKELQAFILRLHRTKEHYGPW